MVYPPIPIPRIRKTDEQKLTIQTFACKKCKKCFRKDAAEFEESDEYCPHCDNHFVLEAVTPKPSLQVEGDDARVDNRWVLLTLDSLWTVG